MFITEPEESDHDYQPVGGTGKLSSINVHTLKFTVFTETRLITKIYGFYKTCAVIVSLSRDLVCDTGMSGVVYFIITYSEDKCLIY